MRRAARPFAGSRARLVACFLACAWLAGTLAPSAHLALVEHVHCAVHEILEHGVRADHGPHGSDASASERREGAQLASASGEGAHEACRSTLAPSRAPVPALARAQARAALAPRPPAPCLGAERAFIGVSLVQLAPKHSPPA